MESSLERAIKEEGINSKQAVVIKEGQRILQPRIIVGPRTFNELTLLSSTLFSADPSNEGYQAAQRVALEHFKQLANFENPYSIQIESLADLRQAL